MFFQKWDLWLIFTSQSSAIYRLLPLFIGFYSEELNECNWPGFHNLLTHHQHWPASQRHGMTVGIIAKGGRPRLR